MDFMALYCGHSYSIVTVDAMRFPAALQGAPSLHRPMSVLDQSRRSVQEKPVLCVLNYPLKAFPEVISSHCTASDNCPFMCLDSIQLQSLSD